MEIEFVLKQLNYFYFLFSLFPVGNQRHPIYQQYLYQQKYPNHPAEAQTENPIASKLMKPESIMNRIRLGQFIAMRQFIPFHQTEKMIFSMGITLNIFCDLLIKFYML